VRAFAAPGTVVAIAGWLEGAAGIAAAGVATVGRDGASGGGEAGDPAPATAGSGMTGVGTATLEPTDDACFRAAATAAWAAAGTIDAAWVAALAPGSAAFAATGEINSKASTTTMSAEMPHEPQGLPLR